MDSTTVSADPISAASADKPKLDAVLFATVKQQEAAAIQSRREMFKIEAQGDLGLAISGGGIRSATFSLGILQYLAKSGLLRHVDYISTVSGGGYIGSWLYSWIRREQQINEQPPDEVFDGVCEKLSPEDNRERPVGNPEPAEIAFLRQYSNYLTPRKSAFSADTWLVFATWARNTILNLAILIAALGALVVLVRLLGLWAARASVAIAAWTAYDSFGIISGLISIALLFPMLRMMGRNLNRISTIALSGDAATRAGEDDNISVIKKCATVLPAAIVYSLWLYTARSVFDAGLFTGIAANWGILFFAFFYLQRKSLVLQCHKSKLKEAGIAEPPALRFLNAAMEVVGPLTAAFVTACLLRVTALFLISQAQLSRGPWVMFTWGPPLVLASFALGVVLHLGLMGRDLPEASREWFARLRGWLLIYTALWVAIVGAAVFGPWVVAWLGVTSKTALATMGTGWVVTTLAGVLAGKSSRTGGKSQDATGKGGWGFAEVAAHAGPYLFIAGFVLSVAFGIHAILVHNIDVTKAATPPPAELYNLQVRDNQIQVSRQERTTKDTGFQWIKDRYWPSLTATEVWVAHPNKRWLFSGLLLLLPALLAAGLLLSWRVDINHFSMHNFYKNRLVRCYLGASHEDRKPNPFTQFDDLDDVALASYTPEKGYYGPYPIVNAALNVSSGGKLQYQERQAQSFIFTPKYAGFSAETVVDEMRLGDECGAALNRYAKDGAAAKDQAGARGYRPTQYAGGGVSTGMAVAISGAAVNPNMGYHTSTAVSFLLTVFNVRLGWWFGNPLKATFNGLGPGIGFLYIVRELFGLANANSSYVNLSDGGHFDNMGIYELVRRGCRYIICCDGEQDPEPSFGGIGNAIRKCRTDFGVEIDLPLEPLRKVDGFSRAHCVVGRIRYKPSGRDEDRDEDQGYLVYLKTALTGDEPSDVLEYRARAPEFPQQTTGDQWFDESQFESYRRLGYHTGKKAFGSGDIGDMDEGKRDRFFEDLYQVWYPPNGSVDTHTPAHAEIYARAMEAVRKDNTLAGLDPSLFPGFDDTGVDPKWKRNEALMCTSLIQLMERVFYDLKLEDMDARRHPYVQGWINIFTRWAHAEAFNHAWARTQKSYPERFRDFYEWLSQRDAGGGRDDGRRSIARSTSV